MHLEHVNFTVPDAKATAQILCKIFDWHIRWQGAAKNDGFTVHVGDEDSYLALYTPKHDLNPEAQRYHHIAGLNHVGVVVADIDAVEAHVRAAGYTPTEREDYEPGLRFYFDGPHGMEFEVVQYA